MPNDIHLDCSCPGGATLCKQVAAVLCGIGARFDSKPELLAALPRAGSLNNAAARAATGLDAEAMRSLPRQLMADGHARVQGQRRGTRYVAVGKDLKA